MKEEFFLTKAIEKAKESVDLGGFPAGAIIVRAGKIIGEGVSLGNKLHDPTNHAEVAAIRSACKELTSSDLSGSILFSSMEPCSMCLAAAMWSSVPEIVFACPKEKLKDEYYGGHYQILDLNETFAQPLKLIPFGELENDSLKIVNDWEASVK